MLRTLSYRSRFFEISEAFEGSIRIGISRIFLIDFRLVLGKFQKTAQNGYETVSVAGEHRPAYRAAHRPTAHIRPPGRIR